MQRMNGTVPVFNNVEDEVDDQQRIDRPFDGLLNLAQLRLIYRRTIRARL
jgi:hypothetical protein